MNNRSNKYKYPRTQHLPWSQGGTVDDVKLISVNTFADKNVIVTEKLDGENTTMYSDYIHARSIDSRHHYSRDWVKNMHASIAHLIPDGWRLCGENVYAKHSIYYENLESYFYLFSIWDQDNRCLSWVDTVEWSQLLGLPVPAILYQGQWNEKAIRGITIDTNKMEGYVVRVAHSFAYDQFSHSVAKWVRTHHVQTDQHWMEAEIEPNQLKENDHGD